MEDYKKIGIVWDLVSYGGVQTCVIVLIKKLNSIGIVPTLLSRFPPNFRIIEEFDLKLDYKIVKYDFDYLNKYLPVYIVDFFVFLDLKKFNFDFYYIFDANVMVHRKQKFVFYLSMSPLYLNSVFDSSRYRVKYCIYNITRWFIPKFDFKHISDSCVINSDFTANIFYENYGKKIEVVCPPSLMPKICVDQLLKKEINKNVLFLSRIELQKRPHLFIDLARAFPDFCFYLSGSITDLGCFNQLTKIIREFDLTNVFIMNNLNQSQLLELIDSCTYYFFGARNEHFGITTLDVIRRGLVPFVHNTGGQQIIVPNEELRFEDDNMVLKFNNLISKTQLQLIETRNSLFEYIERFDNDNFEMNLLMKLYND